MYPIWYYNYEKQIKLSLKVAIPIITFIVGLLLPSPFNHRADKNSDTESLVYSDTIFYCDNGAKYEGKVLVGTRIRYGYGSLSFENSTIYEGEWKNDKLSYGTRKSLYSEYKGHFNESLQNDGYGIVEYSNEYIAKKTKSRTPPNEIVVKYIGNWKEDKKNGIGRSFKADGSIEFGQYNNGEISTNSMLHDVSCNVYGIDVSHYQSDIDWDNLALYGDKNGNVKLQGNASKSYLIPITFVYLKATEGATVKDKTYAIRSIEADKHGITKGAYHFLHLRSDINEQIKNFLETASWVEGDLPPALDVECDDEIREKGNECLRTAVFTWIKAVEKHYHVKPIIYTREDLQDIFVKDSRFKDCMYWIARPNKKPVTDQWMICQISHSGNVKGSNGHVDINVFNGNFSSFRNFISNRKSS